jgi:hypothetical protein
METTHAINHLLSEFNRGFRRRVGRDPLPGQDYSTEFLERLINGRVGAPKAYALGFRLAGTI